MTAKSIDWSAYPNFTESEFRCRESGENQMSPVFMERLQALRTEYGQPMRVTSGYRSLSHSVERKKAQGGWHTKGLAVDISCFSDEAYSLVKLALKHGFTGIGVSQKSGGARFVHLDMRTTTPVIYSY